MASAGGSIAFPSAIAAQLVAAAEIH